MPRRVTIIEVKNRKPDTFIKLCQDIIDQNNALGALSPFADGTIVNMIAYQNLLNQARDKRQEALEHYALAQAAMFESRRLIGIANGQTVNTPGTLFAITTKIKKYLQMLNNTNPEALSLWGFNVVVRMAKNPGRKRGR